MESILDLFGNAASYLVKLSLLLPIITSIIARRKKVVFTTEMKLLEILVYLTLIAQLTSHSTWFNFNLDSNLIFILYLPIHIAILSYILLKISGLFKNVLTIVVGLTIISIIIEIIWSSPKFSAEVLFWFDNFLLLAISLFLSYKRDKDNIKIKHEYNYIHNGVYVSSLLTILGIALPRLDILFFGLFIHTIANISCNFYFARSFKCLYR